MKGWLGGVRRGRAADSAAPEADARYRDDVAQNEATPPETLEWILAQGRDDIVAQCAAQNPHCPAASIESAVEKGLATKGGTYVLLAALRNPACPPYVLASTARRALPDEATRAALKHPGFPPAILAELAEGCRDDDLLAMIVQAPHCPEAIINAVACRRDLVRARVEALRNPLCNAESIKTALSDFRSDLVSRTALHNPNCPPEAVAAILSREADDDLSVWAAQHPKCSADMMLLVLSRDAADRVSRAVAARSDCPAPLVQRWKEATGPVRRKPGA
jgi:hypothetical protein